MYFIRYRLTLLNIYLGLFFCLILLIPASVSWSRDTKEQWHYIGKYKGVDIYRFFNESERILPFKAVTTLNVSYKKIIMALVDAEHKANWAPKLKSAALHSRISANCFEYSEYYQTPWPFKDREFLITGTVTYQRDRILLTAINSKNKQLARDNHVLVNIQMLTFAVIPLADNKTKVEFTFAGDLGEKIPAFVKTIIQKKWPVRFIRALENYVVKNDALESDRYRSLKKTEIVIPRNRQ